MSYPTEEVHSKFTSRQLRFMHQTRCAHCGVSLKISVRYAGDLAFCCANHSAIYFGMVDAPFSILDIPRDLNHLTW